MVSSGNQHYSNVSGASVEFIFSGTSIQWIGSRDINCGFAEVYIDDKLVAVVDQYAPVVQSQAVLYSKDSLAAGEHTLKIIVTPNKNFAATDIYTAIDAFKYTPLF